MQGEIEVAKREDLEEMRWEWIVSVFVGFLKLDRQMDMDECNGWVSSNYFKSLLRASEYSSFSSCLDLDYWGFGSVFCLSWSVFSSF
jgi:hypothetical protein